MIDGQILWIIRDWTILYMKPDAVEAAGQYMNENNIKYTLLLRLIDSPEHPYKPGYYRVGVKATPEEIIIMRLRCGI